MRRFGRSRSGFSGSTGLLLVALSVIMAAALITGPAWAGSTKDPPPGSSVPAASAERPLGRGHLWLKVDGLDFNSDVNEEWGVDTEAYVGLEGYWQRRGRFYIGIEIGHIDVGSASDADGNRLEGVAFTNGELNGKALFPLKHGLSAGVGAGLAGVWVEGEEIDEFGPTDLADISFGAQGFAELNWRVRRLVTGLELKYQIAEDVWQIDYSNLRLGVRLGVVF